MQRATLPQRGCRINVWQSSVRARVAGGGHVRDRPASENSSQLRKLPLTFEAWMTDRHSGHEPHAVGAVDIAPTRPRPRHSLARLLVAFSCILSCLDAGSSRGIFSVLPSLPTRRSGAWQPSAISDLGGEALVMATRHQSLDSTPAVGATSLLGISLTSHCSRRARRRFGCDQVFGHEPLIRQVAGTTRFDRSGDGKAGGTATPVALPV
jgi:hypothetical protein